jgi:hypothetical protein
VQADRTPLAQVGSSTLYIDELPDWVSSSDDKTALKQGYINQWIRKKTMVNAAEDYLGDDLNIDQLLQDYKESLLMINLEQELVKQKMDTFVTNMQVSQYYSEHSDDYLLKEEAIKVIYIQCQDSTTIEAIDAVWEKTSIEKNLANIDLSPCNPLWLDNSSFVHKSSVSSTLPDGINKKIKWQSDRTYNFTVDNTSYFLKIDEVLKPREEAPLSLVKENIIKLILHDRKMKLIKDYEDNLIEEGIKSKYITLYNTQ